MSRHASGCRPGPRARAGLALMGLLLLSARVAADERDYLPALRLLFYEATVHASAVPGALSFLKARFPASEASWPPVAQAYLGALEGLQARYAHGLFEKLSHVQRAIGLLRELPQRAPRDPEVLFLRFSLFHQLPAFFGVGSTVAPDLDRLIALLELRRYEQVPREVQRSMAVYLYDCGLADRSQAERLRQFLEDSPP